MDKLPADLLPNVIRHSTVRDTLSLRSAANNIKGSAIVKECDRRLCVKTYLSRTFKDPVKLLTTMSKNRVVLSGQRALDFFVPGSCEADSQWDFYAERDCYGINAFVEQSKEAGVRWFRPMDKVIKMAREGRGAMVTSVSVWRRLESENVKDVLGKMDIEVDVSLRALAGVIVIATVPGSIEVREHRAEGYRLGAARTVYGEIESDGIVSDVQLVWTPYKNILHYRFLFDYYLSCLQCCITGHTAFHLYGLTSSFMRTHRWNIPHRAHTGHIASSRFISNSKCEVKGYSEEDLKLGGRTYSLRSSNDEECTAISCYNFSDAPTDAVMAYEDYSESIMWMHTMKSVAVQIVPAFSIGAQHLPHLPWIVWCEAPDLHVDLGKEITAEWCLD